MPLIHGNNSLPLEPGKSLFDYADDLAVRVPTSCGRTGECHECIVEVRRGMDALDPLTDSENFLRENYRLACQATVVDIEADIEFNILRRQPRILTESIDRDDIELDPLTVREGDHIIYKGESAPFAKPKRPSSGARASGAMRAGDAHHGPRVIDRYRGRILGIAADIGTTTVAMNLVDLESGDILYTASFENPQRFGGSDVMHRISYETGTYRGELQAVLISSINYEIGEMVRNLRIPHRIRRRQIVEFVAVGNTTMRDMLFGIDVEPIGTRPYKSHIETDFLDGKRDTTTLNVPAHELGIRINPNANVYSGPLIASHIGSDVAADLLTIGIDQEDETVMLIDIGTNTEIIAGNRHQLHAASCPAGPAFEGGNVTYAMPGYDGAVERVKIPTLRPFRNEGDAKGAKRHSRGMPGAEREAESPPPRWERTSERVTGPGGSDTSTSETADDALPSPARRERARVRATGPGGATPLLTTIGNTTPIGICGSGLIDLLAELRRHDIMNELGNFNDGSDEYTFHPENQLSLSRADISALAQAKAANYCGQNIVLETVGTTPTDYTRLYLAGGFANYINIQNAISIGFIPNIDPQRITKIGNASLQGATIMLTNATKRATIEHLTQQITHIELETNPNFFDHFVEGCQFKK